MASILRLVAVQLGEHDGVLEETHTHTHTQGGALDPYRQGVGMENYTSLGTNAGSCLARRPGVL